MVVKATGSCTRLSLLAAHHCEPGPRQDPGGMKTAGFSEVHLGVSGGTASDHSASFMDAYGHCAHVTVGMVQGKNLLTTSSVFFFVSNAKLFTLCWSIGDLAVALVVKNPPASEEDIRDVGSIPGSEHPLEEGMARHSSILAWRIPWTEEPGRL